MQLNTLAWRLLVKGSGILPDAMQIKFKKESNHEKAPVLHHFYHAFQHCIT